MWKNGRAMVPSSATPSTTATKGCPVTNLPHTLPRLAAFGLLPVLLKRLAGALIRPPSSSRIAGTTRIVISIAVKTQSAPATPMAVRNGTPTKENPTRAIITVTPANTTALPAVPFAMAIASRRSYPSASCWRYLAIINSA
ncbi:hypothetical protein D3C81_1722280 [compost metagenome]